MRGKSKGDTTAERVVSVYSHIDCRTHHTTRERDHVEEGRRLVLVPPIVRTTVTLGASLFCAIPIIQPAGECASKLPAAWM